MACLHGASIANSKQSFLLLQGLQARMDAEVQVLHHEKTEGQAKMQVGRP